MENRAAAEATGKKAMINHYKNDGSFTLKDNNGTIFGTFTDRGIEFTVTDFSPFTVGLVEDDTPPTDDTTPSYPGGYYPVVTPDKDATTEEKPTETKPTTPAQPTTPPVVEDDVTPEPEDTTPVVPDEPVVDDPVVDETPADDATQPDSNNAGLWIGIGIVALAAIVVVLAIMAVRKKHK